MIGVFDSGHGGLTVLRALAQRFPHLSFAYLGDHANAPYGDRPSQEIVDFTRAGVDALFHRGCSLVLLGCNTATCVAARALQRDWLPASPWRGRNILGIVAPTVEAATQTPWAVTKPQYPQKYNTDLIAVFGTTRTIASRAYPEEIRKRCPQATIVQQACAELAGAIEKGAPEPQLNELVERSVMGLQAQTRGASPHCAILGCTHYPLVEHLFRRHLPAATRLLSQPMVVANSLDDYLNRHPEHAGRSPASTPVLLTTAEPGRINAAARIFWPDAPAFERLQR